MSFGSNVENAEVLVGLLLLAAGAAGWWFWGRGVPSPQSPPPPPPPPPYEVPDDGFPRGSWHGTFLSEDEIVVDMLARVRADPEGVRRWRDPRSWSLSRPHLAYLAPEYEGCLLYAGMAIRNYYGLWHPRNPYTRFDRVDDDVTAGVVTDPLHPDNLSGRVIDRVIKALGGFEVPSRGDLAPRGPQSSREFPSPRAG